MEEVEFYCMVFQDSDVANWLEAVAWSLCQKPDPELEQTADEVIELVAAAQCEDGYLITYFTGKAPGERWTNLAECHELYCAGHMIEAGVAWFQGTGKRRLLEVVCKLADHIDSVFGPGENQLHGYPGHPEIALALMRLYDVTQEPRYMALVNYFIEARGTTPHFYDIEYEKRGRTSHWHNYGPALKVNARQACGWVEIWPSASWTSRAGSARKAAARPSAAITICLTIRCMQKAAPLSA